MHSVKAVEDPLSPKEMDALVLSICIEDLQLHGWRYKPERGTS
jgi:hypothetical protein